MAAESPTSTFALHPDLLAELVASSGTFQTLVGAPSDATAAKAFCYYPMAKDDGTEDPPRAIITNAPQQSMSEAGLGTWNRSGQLYLTFEFSVPAGDDDASEKQQYIYFQNRLGDMVEEMMATVSARTTMPSGNGPLNVINWDVEDGPYMEDFEEAGYAPGEGPAQPRWWIVLLCGWQM